MNKEMLNRIKDGLALSGDVESAKALEFLQNNWNALLGLDIGVFAQLLEDGADNTKLAQHYDKIVAEMSWPERIEFMREGVDKLIDSGNAKYKELAIISGMMETSGAVLSLLRSLV